MTSSAFAGPPGAAAKPDTRRRDEIPAEYRWDFSDVYPGWAAWEEAIRPEGQRRL